MNFKFTKAKTIVSIIIGIFGALFFSPILSASILVWSLIQKVPE